MSTTSGLALALALAAATAGTATAQVSLGVRADLVAFGRMKTDRDENGQEIRDVDTTDALAIRATLDLGRYVSIGFAPRIVYGVHGFNILEWGNQTDLLGLVEVHAPVTPCLSVGVFATAGYSSLDFQAEPAGAAWGAGAVMRRRLAGDSYVSLEVGYQVANQRDAFGAGDDGIYQTRLPYLGLGAGQHF